MFVGPRDEMWAPGQVNYLALPHFASIIERLPSTEFYQKKIPSLRFEEMNQRAQQERGKVG